MIDSGITMRDYFAAKALEGLLAADTSGSYEAYAIAAYKYADAMLKERDKECPTNAGDIRHMAEELDPMLDLNAMRAEFAAYLTDNFHKSKSLDAALMYVLTRAYERGLADGREECKSAILAFKESKA